MRRSTFFRGDGFLWLGAALLALTLLVLGVWLVRPAGGRTISAELSISDALGSSDTDGFARALRPRPFEFPRDHGPHPDYRTEWWYVTANLGATEGQAFGVQWTVFRTSLSPTTTREPVTAPLPSATSPGDPFRPTTSSNPRGEPLEDSEAERGWRTNQAYMGHFALTDVEARRHYRFERFTRGALGLAGARAHPFAVWLEDWRLDGRESDSLFPLRLYGEEEGVRVELSLTPLKPLVLQGDSGLSQKGPGAGNASYYYSFSRLQASGTVSVGGTAHAVSGTAWLDREWSTSALAPDQIGWDWFALQLSDGRDVMLYQMRRHDGSADPWSSGTLVEPDGESRALDFAATSLRPTGSWTSPAGTVYPSGWQISIPDERMELEVVPVIPDQEMDVTFRYWEGAVRVSGFADGAPVSGVGYVELTGYHDAAGSGAVGRVSADR